jgi:hypothetical protein
MELVASMASGQVQFLENHQIFYLWNRWMLPDQMCCYIQLHYVAAQL